MPRGRKILAASALVLAGAVIGAALCVWAGSWFINSYDVTSEMAEGTYKLGILKALRVGEQDSVYRLLQLSLDGHVLAIGKAYEDREQRPSEAMKKMLREVRDYRLQYGVKYPDADLEVEIQGILEAAQ